MGYCSSFSLSAYPVDRSGNIVGKRLTPALQDAVNVEIKKIDVFKLWDHTENTWEVGQDTWYSEQEDMVLLSTKFPSVFFAIHREGENNGDMMDTYYWNGKMQICPAIITYDDYDPAKMEQQQMVEHSYCRYQL